MSATDLEREELTVMKTRFDDAIEFLKQNVSEEKLDDMYAYAEKLEEMANSGEKIDAGEVVAELMHPRKFGLKQEIVEEFLRRLIGTRPDADKLIAGTIEYAKRKIWGEKWR